MHLILGQGLAGTAIAWRLWERGLPFLIVDRDEPVTSSKIAAGLLTPITGMRMSLNENYGPWLCEAVTFYRHKERLLGQRFLHAQPHLRLCKNGKEAERWAKRQADAEVQRFTRALRTPDPSIFTNQHGGFEMKHAGWLDTAGYLSASRAYFENAGCWMKADLSASSIALTQDHVTWQGRDFSHVIHCTGWAAMKHPLFDWVPFQPVRGTILTARADLQGERRILHHGCWMLPHKDGTLRVGSTFELRFDDPHGFDAEAVDELKRKLHHAVPVPVEILDQQSAVRPAIAQQRTLIGTHPAQPRVAFFNGLGSKGTLRAPHFSALLVRHLIDQKPLPPAFDLRGNL